MNEEQFFYWLKGLADTSGVPTSQQWKLILKELNDIDGKSKRLEASKNVVLQPVSYYSSCYGAKVVC